MEIKFLVHDEIVVEGTVEDIREMVTALSREIVKRFEGAWHPIGTTVSLHFKFPPFPGTEPTL